MCSAENVVAATGIFSNFFQREAESTTVYNQQMQEYYNAHTRWDIEKRRNNEQKKMLEANAIFQLQQLQNRQQEINDSAVHEKSEIGIASLRAKAAAELAAGEANVSGRSVNQLLGSIEAEAQRKNASVEASRENQISDAQAHKQGVIQSKEMVPIYGVLPDMPTKASTSSNLLASIAGGIGQMDFSGLLNTRCQSQVTRCPPVRCG